MTLKGKYLFRSITVEGIYISWQYCRTTNEICYYCMVLPCHETNTHTMFTLKNIITTNSIMWNTCLFGGQKVEWIQKGSLFLIYQRKSFSSESMIHYAFFLNLGLFNCYNRSVKWQCIKTLNDFIIKICRFANHMWVLLILKGHKQ